MAQTPSKLTILITGANQGLGFEAAKHLSQHPHVHLFISGRNSERVQEALKRIAAEPGCQAKVEAITIDVSRDDSIKRAAEELQNRLGGEPLDVLVNNAGIALDGKVGSEKTLREVFEETFATNVFGAASLSDACLPLLKESRQEGGGRIVNVSSGLGSNSILADPDGEYKGVYPIAYNASKAALNSITITFAMKNPDLHVVTLDPGYNATNLNAYSGPKDPKDGAKVIADYALERKGTSPGYYKEGGEVPW